MVDGGEDEDGWQKDRGRWAWQDGGEKRNMSRVCGWAMREGWAADGGILVFAGWKRKKICGRWVVERERWVSCLDAIGCNVSGVIGFRVHG